MSESELNEEILNLKDINSNQSRKIEEYEQKIYELKRQLSTAKAMEEHMTLEIESLQKNDINDNIFVKRITILEEEIYNLKQTNIQNVQYYEAELNSKDAQIKSIANAKHEPNIDLQTSQEDIQKYTEEIFDLKFKLEELNEKLIDTETKYQEMSLKNNALESQINELNNDLKEVKDCLQAKRDELEESKELMRNLQDEITVLQTEINNYKSLPMEKAVKGNSLFAEVDDYRLKVEKTMSTMKKKYIDLKAQYSKKCQELQKLHVEYVAVIKVIENKNDFTQEKFELEQHYERHFKLLNERIKSLEDAIEQQKKTYTKLVAKDWKSVEHMLSVAREEIRSLEMRLSAESLGIITSESNHLKTKRELKKWQAEAMHLRAQILSLNQTIDELKLATSPPAIPEDNPTKSCLTKNFTDNYKSAINPPKISQQDNLINSCLKKNPILLNSPFDDWGLSDSVDDSFLPSNKDNLSKLGEYSLMENITVNSDFSMCDLSTKSIKNELLDEAKPVEEIDQENKENIFVRTESSPSKSNSSKENSTIDISDKKNCSELKTENIPRELDDNNSVLNNTMENFTSRMKKVTFENNIEEPSKTKKLGGRKIIVGQPIHIPSIKRN